MVTSSIRFTYLNLAPDFVGAVYSGRGYRDLPQAPLIGKQALISLCYLQQKLNLPKAGLKKYLMDKYLAGDNTTIIKFLKVCPIFMSVPVDPKIYHIVHVDKLASIATDGFLWSDAKLAKRPVTGTVIGMNTIKARRMSELRLKSHPDLFVGQCVPFYFCPRSVMLFVIHRKNSELSYQDGQEPIVHLVADLNAVVKWANANQRRWAFTLSNAGSSYFEDRCDLANLDEIDWSAVQTKLWSDSPTKENKQAEFLLEQQFPWQLIEEVAVINQLTGQLAGQAIAGASHRPTVQIRTPWYY